MDAEALADLVKERISFFEALQNVHVPDSIKAATAEDWKLHVDELELAGLEHYDAEQKKADSQRIIPLTAALVVIREVEEEMVRKLVLDPLDVYLRNVAGKWKYAKYFIAGLGDWESLWKDAKFAWSVISKIDFEVDLSSVGAIIATALSLVWQVITNIFSFVLEFAAAAVITAQVIKVIKHRDNFAEKMRKKAFPQHSGPRFLRRIPSRQ